MGNGKLEARITVPTGGWALAITEVPAAGPITITLPAGTYYHSSVGSGTDTLGKTIADLADADATLAGDYTLAVSAGEAGTGKYTLSATGITSFTFTWTDTELRDLLGFDGTETGTLSYTGNDHAESLWLPGYPYQTKNGSAWPGKIVSDQQSVTTASGHVYSVMGRKRREKSIVWPAEARAKCMATNETTTNESFETFLIDGIYGEAAWGTSAGPVRFHGDADVDGTYLTLSVLDMGTWDPAELREHWTGAYAIVLPRCIQVPT